MDTILIIIMVLLLVVNVVSFILSRKSIKRMNDKNANAGESYSKGMKYVVLSIVTSILSLIVITIVLIRNVLKLF